MFLCYSQDLHPANNNDFLVKINWAGAAALQKIASHLIQNRLKPFIRYRRQQFLAQALGVGMKAFATLHLALTQCLSLGQL
jgi:hypothetical protein